MTSLPRWVDDYRGRPFERGRDGPDAFDCYGLVRAVLRDQWGAETPPLDGVWHLGLSGRLTAALVDPECPWTDVPQGEALAPGDVLTMTTPGGARELHVGVVVDERWFLHARQEVGVQTARHDQGVWRTLRFGPAYRHRDLVGAERPR